MKQHEPIDNNPIPDYLEFMSNVIDGLLHSGDDAIRNATKEAAELAKHPRDIGLQEGLRAHVILQGFRGCGTTGFEDHFSQWISSISARKLTEDERRGLRPVRSNS